MVPACQDRWAAKLQLEDVSGTWHTSAFAVCRNPAMTFPRSVALTVPEHHSIHGVNKQSWSVSQEAISQASCSVDVPSASSPQAEASPASDLCRLLKL